MWLHIDFYGVALYFKVSGYSSSSSSACCHVEVNLKSEPWLDYKSSGACWFADEVEVLLSALEDLIENRVCAPTELGFLDSDFRFVFNPQKRVQKDCAAAFAESANDNADVSVDFRIHLLHGIPTNNYFSLNMNREAISAFIVYLKVITKQIDAADELVKEQIRKGTLVEYY